MSRSRRVLLILMFLVPVLSPVIITPAFSGVGITNPCELTPRLDSLFTEGRFSELEISALRILREDGTRSESERIGAHLYLGFVEVVSDRLEAAESDFLSALELDPGLRLDPVYVPPRVLDVFDRVRREFRRSLLAREARAALADSLAAESVTEALPYRSRSLGPLLLNLAVPGAGFIVEGRWIRGSLWLVFQSATAAGLVVSLDHLTEARDAYYKTTGSSQFDQTYSEYNRWYRRTWAWGAAFTVVYLASQTDFQLLGARVNLVPASLDSEGSGAPGIRITLTAQADAQR